MPQWLRYKADEDLHVVTAPNTSHRKSQLILLHLIEHINKNSSLSWKTKKKKMSQLLMWPFVWAGNAYREVSGRSAIVLSSLCSQHLSAVLSLPVWVPPGLRVWLKMWVLDQVLDALLPVLWPTESLSGLLRAWLFKVLCFYKESSWGHLKVSPPLRERGRIWETLYCVCLLEIHNGVSQF